MMVRKRLVSLSSNSAQQLLSEIQACEEDENEVRFTPSKHQVIATTDLIADRKKSVGQESQEDWPEARKRAWEWRFVNPNSYYYRWKDFDEDLRTGPWSTPERQHFLETLKANPPAQGCWGLFSRRIPGRVGYQCLSLYNLLKEQGIDVPVIEQDQGQFSSPKGITKKRKRKGRGEKWAVQSEQPPDDRMLPHGRASGSNGDVSKKKKPQTRAKQLEDELMASDDSSLSSSDQSLCGNKLSFGQMLMRSKEPLSTQQDQEALFPSGGLSPLQASDSPHEAEARTGGHNNEEKQRPSVHFADSADVTACGDTSQYEQNPPPDGPDHQSKDRASSSALSEPINREAATTLQGLTGRAECSAGDTLQGTADNRSARLQTRDASNHEHADGPAETKENEQHVEDENLKQTSTRVREEEPKKKKRVRSNPATSRTRVKKPKRTLWLGSRRRRSRKGKRATSNCTAPEEGSWRLRCEYRKDPIPLPPKKRALLRCTKDGAARSGGCDDKWDRLVQRCRSEKPMEDLRHLIQIGSMQLSGPEQDELRFQRLLLLREHEARAKRNAAMRQNLESACRSLQSITCGVQAHLSEKQRPESSDFASIVSDFGRELEDLLRRQALETIGKSASKFLLHPS